MHPTKKLLIERNGLRCMLCGKEVPYLEINWHHIKPKAVCKYLGEPVDDSYENGSLLCLGCHNFIHTIYYWNPEYEKYSRIIRSNRKPATD